MKIKRIILNDGGGICRLNVPLSVPSSLLSVVRELRKTGRFIGRPSIDNAGVFMAGFAVIRKA